MTVRVVGTRLIYLDGQRLAECRRAHSLSMRAVARELGVTCAAVCGWEHETFFPSDAHLLALESLFGDALESLGAIVVEDLK